MHGNKIIDLWSHPTLIHIAVVWPNGELLESYSEPEKFAEDILKLRDMGVNYINTGVHE